MTIASGETGAGTYLVTWNGHGDALALWKVNGDGSLTLANSYTYSTWGAPTTTTHNAIPDLAFRFLYVGSTGVGWDHLHGLGLAFMQARHYSPAIGRFLQPDPSAQEDNLYGYAGNSPLTSVDPDGLRRINLAGGGPGGFRFGDPGGGGAGGRGAGTGGLGGGGGSGVFRLRPPDFNRHLRAAVRKWDKSTYRSPAQSLRDHYERHGAGRALTQGYIGFTKEALRLQGLRYKPGTRAVPTASGPGYKVSRQGRYGIFTADGKIVSYGFNDD